MSAIFYNTLSAVVPILVCLLGGYGLGKVLPKVRIRSAVKCITPVVWMILFGIGLESGQAFCSLAAGFTILKQAALYALTISVVVFALIIPFNYRWLAAHAEPRSSAALLDPIKQCLIAFSLVLLGVIFYPLHWHESPLGVVVLNMSAWLYLLLLLIGMDLAQLAISRAWLAPRVFIIPCLVIIGSLLAGALLSLCTGQPLAVALALSTGFGWYSLSGTLVGQYLGDSYGSIALLNDLLRELIGLTVVFLLGSRYANSSIGVCASTALDTTLPFIRKSCNYHYVPTAIISGLILTVTAPFLMAFFLSLAVA